MWFFLAKTGNIVKVFGTERFDEKLSQSGQINETNEMAQFEETVEIVLKTEPEEDEEMREDWHSVGDEKYAIDEVKVEHEEIWQLEPKAHFEIETEDHLMTYVKQEIF